MGLVSKRLSSMQKNVTRKEFEHYRWLEAAGGLASNSDAMVCCYRHLSDWATILSNNVAYCRCQYGD